MGGGGRDWEDSFLDRNAVIRRRLGTGSHGTDGVLHGNVLG